VHFVLSILAVSKRPMGFPHLREVAATIPTFGSEQTKLPGDCQFGKNGVETSSQVVLAESQSLRNDSGTDAMSQHPNHLPLEGSQGDWDQRSMSAKGRSADISSVEVHLVSPP
jgi:hypothetical protein